MLINKEWSNKYDNLAVELEETKKQLFEAVTDNQRLTDEKSRIMGVNSML